MLSAWLRPLYLSGTHKWICLCRLKILHCGHCNLRLYLASLTSLFSLKIKFYSHWTQSSLGQTPSDPRPDLVFYKLNPVWPWTQSSRRNAQSLKVQNAKAAELGCEGGLRTTSRGSGKTAQGLSGHPRLVAYCPWGSSGSPSVLSSDTRTVKR